MEVLFSSQYVDSLLKLLLFLFSEEHITEAANGGTGKTPVPESPFE